MKMKSQYYQTIKITNKSKWAEHIKRVINKYKSITPDICNHPTDVFLDEIMAFDFEYEFVPISRLRLKLSSAFQNLLQILRCRK